jgi:hypothetical protein
VKREITLYLLVKKSSTWRNGNDLSLVSATTTPPTHRPKGSILFKQRIRIDDDAFSPAAIPSLVADIPLEAILPTPDDIEVEILDRPEV